MSNLRRDLSDLRRVPCGCVFHAEGEMEMHKYCPAHRPQVGVYSCGECEASFLLFEDLQSHVMDVHFLDLPEAVVPLATIDIPKVPEMSVAS